MNTYIIHGEKERCKSCGEFTKDYARFPTPEYLCPKCTAAKFSDSLVDLIRQQLNKSPFHPFNLPTQWNQKKNYQEKYRIR